MRHERPALPVLFTAPVAGPALADGAAGKGTKSCSVSKPCHDIGEGAKDRVGPGLTGIVGKAIAAAGGFSCSDAFPDGKAVAFTRTGETPPPVSTSPRALSPATRRAWSG